MSDTQSDPTLGPWEMDEPGSNRWEILSTGTSRRFNKVAIVYAPKEDGRIDREKGIANARFIAAAGTAAHELPGEYDPVAAVEQLPELLRIVQQLENWQSRNGTKPTLADIHDVLNAARGD